MRTLALIALSVVASVASAQGWRVSSDQAVGGFKFPESAAYDPQGKVLYVGNFGGEKLDPAGKTGTGYISKVGLNGKVIQEKALGGTASTPMNKPKGIWIQGGKLWVTDIDSVWIFDLKSKKGRKLDIGATFANDPCVMGKALYVSDNRGDKVYKIEPADFMSTKSPKVTEAYAGGGVNPNGLYPSKTGMLLMAGFNPPDPRPLAALGVSGQVVKLTDAIGRLDGLYELPGGGLLYTDWATSSLSMWSDKDGVKKLAEGFKGPADFGVIPKSKSEMTVVVPDLVQSQLRFIHLRKQ
ncbi:MAG TPA: hypothetical protein VGI18_02790 [Burkholderiales bacterium]|jgi:hypothetical protein